MAFERALIERELDSMLRWRGFGAAPKMQQLVRYLVTAVLDGKADQLKGYSIGLDVFERSETFDAQKESVVRVQVGRLRKLIDEYYKDGGEGGGARSPVRFVLPKGSYAIQFEEALSRGSEPPATRKTEPGRPYLLDLARSLNPRGALVIVALLCVLLFLIGAARNGGFGEAAFKASRGPSVMVAAFTPIGADDMSRRLSEGLRNEIVDKLTRFKDLRVFAASPDDKTLEDLDAAARRQALFMLSGSLQMDGDDIRLIARLTRAQDGQVVWSDVVTASRKDMPSVFSLQSTIAIAVAARLAQPYGVLQDQLRAQAGVMRDVDWADYECVLSQVDYARRVSAQAHRRVRDCLEGVTRRAPRYATAWVLLAWIYGEEERNGFNRRENPPPFERAFEAARHAVEADPDSELSHLALASAHFDLGDVAGFRAEASRAIELNANNSEVLASVGERLAILDGSQRAKDLLTRAIELSPNHPPWYENGLAIIALLRHQPAEALAHARAYAQEGDGLPTMILAAAQRENGDGAGADATLTNWQARDAASYERRQQILDAWRIPDSLRGQIFGTQTRGNGRA